MDKPKRQLSEKQKEVLARNNFKNKTPAERSELGAKGAEKTNQIKAAKVKRDNAKEWLWDEYGLELSADVLKNGSIKDKLELLKAILPTDKQINDVNFKNINPDVVVETIEMRKKSEEYTKKLLDD